MRATVFTPLRHGVLKWDLEDWLKFKHIKWLSVQEHKEAASSSVRVRYKYYKDANLSSPYLSRNIMQAPKDKIVDHINHDPLDNRKSNLRLSSKAENCRNARKISKGTSKYKGVHKYRKDDIHWIAQIQKDKVRMHIGFYTSEIEAAKAYNAKALELFGEFAHLNVIEETHDKMEELAELAGYLGEQ